MEDIRSAYLKGALECIRQNRRALHRMPEVGHAEFMTQAYLLERLAELEPDSLEKIAGTGIKCVFFGRAPLAADVKRRTIAFRSDIDALNVCESTGLPFSSERPGFMHACGHDGHMATLLALAGFCSENRSRMLCNAVLLFQPAEESDGGAVPIINAGGLKNPDVDEIYGMHVMPSLAAGTIACPDGPLMASACEFDITIRGTASHGAMPHLGCDALAAAVALYNMMQTVFTRQTDPFEQKVLTIGAMEAGERRNVVADKAVMHATLRTYNEDTEAKCMEHIRTHAAAVESAYGVKCDVDVLARYLPVINAPETAAKVRAAAGSRCVHTNPLTIAEDFAFYQRQVPGAFFFCGIAGGEKYTRSLHASDFDLDESALLGGLEIFLRLLDLQ